MRQNGELMKLIVDAKDEKASKCMNEFKEKDSCKKGKFCRFSHVITDDHRNDMAMRQMMDDRHKRVTGRPLFDHVYQIPNRGSISSNPAWHCDTTFAEGPMCGNETTQAVPHLPPTSLSPSPARPLMSQLVNKPVNFQELQVNGAAQTPDNLQAINLLQNLLSHLMTPSQLNNGQYHSIAYPYSH